ncbi:MAG: DUF1778 domain-containing protein [Polyangiaceae bacterium]
MPLSSPRSEKLDIRIMSAASDTLAERNRIGLTAEDWAAFTSALDAPPRKHPRMKRLLGDPTVLD